MFRTSLFWIGMAGMFASGCEEPKGGFGKADVKDPGVHVKPVTQNPDAAPDFSTAVAVLPRYDAASGMLTVTLALKPGFHAYGPGEEVGRPVSLRMIEQGGWRMEGAPQIPTGTEKDLGDLGKSFVLEGEVPVQVKMSGGTGPIAGELTVQVCTDQACDRPQTHRFEAPTS